MIAVLGRGQSLLKYKNYYKKFNKIYIVNNFNDEIDFLGYNIFKNKEIIQVIGNGHNELISEKYKKMNIKYIQYNRFKIDSFKKIKKRTTIPFKPLPKKMLNRGFPCLNWNLYIDIKNNFDCHKDMIYYVEKKYKNKIKKNIKLTKSHRAWPTTGLLAIDLVLNTNKINNIYLFGFDMYQKNYMTKKNKKYQNKNWTKSKMMIYYLHELVKEFKNIKFYNSSEIFLNNSNYINI